MPLTKLRIYNPYHPHQRGPHLRGRGLYHLLIPAAHTGGRYAIAPCAWCTKNLRNETEQFGPDSWFYDLGLHQ